MRKLLPQLLAGIAVAALTFAIGSGVMLVWRTLPALRSSPSSSAGVFAALTRASVETPWRPEHAEETARHHWIFRRAISRSEHDIKRPVAVSAPDENLITFGCGTLVVSMDDARRLKLNLDRAGSLDDPASLNAKLADIFGARESNRAYKPGMEHRTELPPGERIERTVIINAPATSRFGEILELASFLERAGANPVVLHTGDRSVYQWEAIRE